MEKKNQEGIEQGSGKREKIVLKEKVFKKWSTPGGKKKGVKKFREKNSKNVGLVRG